jgi:hypothetical protein
MEILVKALAVLAWAFSEFLGAAGAALILYSLIAYATQPWPPIEERAQFASAILTLVGALLTAASIYFHSASIRPPWKHSRYLVAPVVIASCLFCLYLLKKNGALSPTLVNGFGMLAISGGLKRVLPYPEEKSK